MHSLPPDHFYSELKRRVYQELASRNIREDEGKSVVFRAGFLVLNAIFWYGCWIFAAHASLWWGLVFTVPLVFAAAMFNFGIFHDASHRALSRFHSVNWLGQRALTLLGASAIGWHHEHVVRHHGHTNVPGLDSDLESGGFLRMHPSQPRHFFHRVQHWYAWPLYGLVALKWAWYEDFDDWFRNPYKLSPTKRAWHAVDIVAAKLLHCGIFLIVPALILGLIPAVILYLTTFGLLGVLIASVFVVAHISGGQSMPAQRSDVPLDWGRFQIATTTNFGTHSWWLTFATGGLNHQIEHHLFPSISHRHFPLVQSVVKPFCQEYGVEYREFSSFPAALMGHFRYLRTLGKPERSKASKTANGVSAISNRLSVSP